MRRQTLRCSEWLKTFVSTNNLPLLQLNVVVSRVVALCNYAAAAILVTKVITAVAFVDTAVVIFVVVYGFFIALCSCFVFP